MKQNVYVCYVIALLYSRNWASWWLSGKESACSVGDTGDMSSIPGSERSLGGGNGNPLQYSCLENPKDRGAWWAIVHRVAKSQTEHTEWCSCIL